MGAECISTDVAMPDEDKRTRACLGGPSFGGGMCSKARVVDKM